MKLHLKLTLVKQSFYPETLHFYTVSETEKSKNNDFWEKKASIERKTTVSSALTPHWTPLPTKHCYLELSTLRNVLWNLCNHDNDPSLWHHVLVGTGSSPIGPLFPPQASHRPWSQLHRSKGKGQGRGQSLGQWGSKVKARKPQIISFDISH